MRRWERARVEPKKLGLSSSTVGCGLPQIPANLAHLAPAILSVLRCDTGLFWQCEEHAQFGGIAAGV